MTPALYVGAVVGCGVGAVLRYLLATRAGAGLIPWHTLAANTLGSFLLGMLAAWSPDHPGWMIVFGAGLGGGLTTFSTLAVEAVGQWREGHRRTAAVYLLLTCVCGVLAATAGWFLIA